MGGNGTGHDHRMGIYREHCELFANAKNSPRLFCARPQKERQIERPELELKPLPSPFAANVSVGNSNSAAVQLSMENGIFPAHTQQHSHVCV